MVGARRLRQNPFKIKNLAWAIEAKAQNLHPSSPRACKHQRLPEATPTSESHVNTKLITAAALALAALGHGPAQAYIVSFGQQINADPGVPLNNLGRATDARTRFAAGSTSLETQGFESLATGVSGPLTLNFGSGDRFVRATLSGTDGVVKEVEPGTTDDGRFSVSPLTSPPTPAGTKFWQTTATSEGATFELWFDNPVEKFGFFGVDVGDFGGLLELELLSGVAGASSVIGTARPADDTTPGNAPIACPAPPAFCSAADGSVLYFGVTARDESEWFRGVRFRSFAPTSVATVGGLRTAAPADVFAFDSFTVVGAARTAPPAPVSAPGTLLLLGTALVGLGLMRRRG
jgi:hypothetical protein